MKSIDQPQGRLFAEFFAGIGLMRMGLELAGWKVAFANDIDPAKFEMYSAQFSDANDHFVPGDIHKIDPSKVPTVDLATASFPCTDLSLAGSRTGLSGKQSSAFWGFVAILAGMGERRPPTIMLENVPGFVTSHGGKDFREALLSLNELGYAVDAFIVDASLFVPQSRQRLFVIGKMRDRSAWPMLARERRSFYGEGLRPKVLSEFITSNPEVNWDIADLPSIISTSRTIVDIIEDIEHTSTEWWSKERADYLFSQMSDRHQQSVRSWMEKTGWSYGTVFRRIRNGKSTAEIRTDGIAGCLRTPKGGSAKQILVKAGNGEYHVRLLTARECARLMGADNYTIKVGLNQALFGFGDAVCVPAVTWIAEQYLNRINPGVGQAGDIESERLELLKPSHRYLTTPRLFELDGAI